MPKDGILRRPAAIASLISVPAMMILASGCGNGIHASGGNFSSGCPAKGLVQPDMIEREGRFIVRLKPSIQKSLGASRMASVLSSLTGVGSQTENIGGDLYQVSANSGQEAVAAAERIAGNPDVEFVEPDYPIAADDYSDDYYDDSDEYGIYGNEDEPYADAFEYADANLNDPGIDKQWGHKAIDSFGAWDTTLGSRSTVVAVIDSGIDYKHSDLAPNMWRNPREKADGRDSDGNGFKDDIYGWDFVNNDASPMADDGPSYHGTHVAGTIGALGGNGIGIAGHSPRVSLMALKTLNSKKSGYTSNMIKAVDYAIRHGAHVINASIGSPNYSSAMYSALERARRADVLFVASAGNQGNNTSSRPSYPASYKLDNVIGVAATNSSDIVPSWSNFSPSVVHIAAPGQTIYSTSNGGYRNLSGTSMASPLVAGVTAMVRSVRPDLSYKEVKSLLMETADRSSALSRKVISGRINAASAMRAALNSAPGSAPDRRNGEDWAIPDDDFQNPCFL